ncbi:MAG: ADP-glyceromanno-heptose 6-epimerase [Deltaproteobacteria bacterium]|nr:ADP-glyceromanno-heptose 6-epimerase [Deltaproteobacteria bacterium]
MIVVTGGAGFIGSAVVWRLNRRGEKDILVVDHLGVSEKWRNLAPLYFSDYLDRDVFIDRLENEAFGDRIRAVIHLGACSSTTERDAGYLMENNYRYTLRLAQWQEQHPGCRFIYASSAATYGDGSRGYRDDESALHALRPLNMYGYSKHLFDLHAARNGWLDRMVGLKYFNVFGPNEDHKGEMRSVIHKAYPGVRDEGTIRLFESYRQEYGDGEQERDFIYVKDAAEMTLFFLENRRANGLFNVGTGEARSWNDVARAMFRTAGRETRIEYIPMPEALREKYQYHTCAGTAKLRAAGCAHRCKPLEDAVDEYIRAYLEKDARLDPDAEG